MPMYTVKWRARGYKNVTGERIVEAGSGREAVGEFLSTASENLEVIDVDEVGEERRMWTVTVTTVETYHVQAEDEEGAAAAVGVDQESHGEVVDLDVQEGVL